jgi:putative addiction module component (TIGR02574 family)
MTGHAQRVLDDGLALPPSERGAVIAKLIDSLAPADDLSEDEWASAWGEEIRRRIESVDSGEVETIPWEEARKTIFRRNHEDDAKDTPSP